MAVGLDQNVAVCRRCQEIDEEEIKKKEGNHEAHTKHHVYGNGNMNIGCKLAFLFSNEPTCCSTLSRNQKTP